MGAWFGGARVVRAAACMAYFQTRRRIRNTRRLLRWLRVPVADGWGSGTTATAVSFFVYTPPVTMNVVTSCWISCVATCAALSAQAPSQTLRPEQIGRSGPVAAQDTAPDFSLPATQDAMGMFARADGTLGADGRGYHADFDTRGATLMVRDPRDDAQSVTLTLRLADWGRGSARTAVEAGSASRSAVDIARYEHAGITELYQLTTTGFEQSFVLAQRPAGSGDLVLGITATGAQLHCPERTVRQQAIEFCVGDAPTFRYGEAVAFSRGSTSRVPVATRYDGNGRIELVVSAEFLEQASYPVIIDPAVGPTHLVSGPGFKDVNADVAYDPTADTFMVVWQREFTTNDRRIRVQRYRRDGSMISGIGPLTGAGFATWPTVNYVGTGGFSGFYVVWSHSTGLRGQLLNSSGTGLFSSVHQLTSVPLGTRDQRPAVSFRAGEMLVAWDRTPNGSANPQAIMIRRCVLQGAPMPTVSLGSDFNVATVTAGYVQRVRMPRTHSFAGGPQARLCWERFYVGPPPGDFDVRIAGVVVSAANIAFTQTPTGMPGGAVIGVNERRPDVAAISATQQALFVWQDGFDITAHRYNMAGPLGNPFSITATSSWETGPTVGAGSTEFSVGYLSAPSGSSFQQDVYAARVLRNGTVLAPDSPISTLSGPLQRGLRASSVANSFANSNEPNGVMFSWLVDSDAFGTINDVRARFYEPVTSSVSPFGSACAGPGGTLPTIQADGSPYPGNAEFGIELSNAPSGSLAALLINDTLTSVPIPGAPGCSLYVDFPLLIALPTITTAGGNAVVPVPIPVGAPAGFLLGFQWGVFTPGHNAFGWISSNGLDISWQQ